MQIFNWLPSNAQQIRYIAPYYEEDGEDRYIVNENEYTEVWHDIIKKVHNTKQPMYYRRRTVDLARRDKHMYQGKISNENNWRNDWAKCMYVRVKVLGRRVLFMYDKEFVHKNWIAYKKSVELAEKIRKLREQKFKDFGKKISTGVENFSILTDLVDMGNEELRTHELMEVNNDN